MTQSDIFTKSPFARKLTAVTVPPGADGVEKLAMELSAALFGTGPAILPVATTPARLMQQSLESLKPDDPNYPLESADISIVCATSGSTGTPRGVLLSQRALEASALAFGARFGTNNRWVISMPVHRIAGIMVLVRSMLYESPFEIDPSVGGARAFDAATFAETTKRAQRKSAEDGRALSLHVPLPLARGAGRGAASGVAGEGRRDPSR